MLPASDGLTQLQITGERPLQDGGGGWWLDFSSRLKRGRCIPGCFYFYVARAKVIRSWGEGHSEAVRLRHNGGIRGKYRNIALHILHVVDSFFLE